MFFDQSNHAVRKVDDFEFNPSDVASLAVYEPASEPKKLQWVMPGNDQSHDTQTIPETNNFGNTFDYAMVSENNPTRLASTVIEQPTEIKTFEMQWELTNRPDYLSGSDYLNQTNQPEQAEQNVVDHNTAMMIDLPTFHVPVTAPQPEVSHQSSTSHMIVQQQGVSSPQPTPTLPFSTPDVANVSQTMPTSIAPIPVEPAQITPEPQPIEQASSATNTGMMPQIVPPNDFSLVENTAERIAANNYTDSDTVQVALHFGNRQIDDYPTDTGDLYITREQLEEILGSRQQTQISPWKKNGLTITPYGYVNVGTSYESSRTVAGDYALYSQSPDLDGGGHSGFHIDPKSTRLGVKVDGPQLPWRCRCFKTSALVEVDFQGANSGGTRNRGALMLRRAFIDFENDDMRLLIGQEWDVVSPLVPQSLNYVPGSYTGNVGYRRAQIRLEKTRKWSNDLSTIWQFALCDNVPMDYITDTSINKANSGWPMLQGRVGTSFWQNPRANCEPVTIGLSAHLGELTFDYRANSMDKRRHETWSVNLDVDVPVTSRLRLSGEIYTGANLATMLAGIGQGIDLYDRNGNFDPRSADAYGGWLNLSYKWTKKFRMNAGYSIERIDGLTASNPLGGDLYSARDKNQMLYLNGVYNWTNNFLTGLEVSQWRTDWHEYNATTQMSRDLKPGETTRIELLTRYSF